MRIPNNLVVDNLISAMNRSLARINRRQMEIATGLRLMKPSDDPPGTIRALSLRRAIGRNAQFRKNIADGTRWNAKTEESLQSIVETLMKMKETAVQGANEASGGQGALGDLVDQLLGELLDQSASRLDGRSIYSGYRTAEAPFLGSDEVLSESFVAGSPDTYADLEHAKIAAGTVTITDSAGATIYAEGIDYSIDYETGRVTTLAGGAMVPGDAYLASYRTETISSVDPAFSPSGEMVRRIDEDREITVNLLGSDVFQGDVDLFRLAVDLKDALWKGNAQAVGALLESIDGALEEVTGLLGLVGSRAESLGRQDSQLAQEELLLREFLGTVEGADLDEAVIELQAEQLAYEAALMATAKTFELNLMRFI